MESISAIVTEPEDKEKGEGREVVRIEDKEEPAETFAPAEASDEDTEPSEDTEAARLIRHVL